MMEEKKEEEQGVLLDVFQQPVLASGPSDIPPQARSATKYSTSQDSSTASNAGSCLDSFAENFVCGVGYSCASTPPLNDPSLNLSYHLSGWLMIAALSAATLLVYTVVYDTEYHDALLWRWFLLLDVAAMLSYVGMMVQRVLVKTTSLLLSRLRYPYIKLFFLLKSCLTSFAALTAEIVIAVYWEDIMDVKTLTHTSLITAFIVVTILHVLFKYLEKNYVFKHSRNAYYTRLQELALHMSLLVQLIQDQHTSANIVSEDASFNTLRAVLLDSQTLLSIPVTEGQTTSRDSPFNSNDNLTASNIATTSVGRSKSKHVPTAVKVQYFQKQIFQNLVAAAESDPVTSARCISKDHVMDWFEEPDRANSCWKWFTSLSTSSAVVSPAQLRAVLHEMFLEQKTLQMNIGESDRHTTALVHVMSILFWFVMVLVVMNVFGYTLANILLTFGAVVVSVSFALGTWIKNVVESIVFVTMTTPFEHGDRIRVQSIPDEKFLVEELNLWSSTLRNIKNEVFIVPNYVMAGMAIVNLTRSQNAVFITPFEVNIHTDPAKLVELQKSLEAYVKKNSASWLPECAVRINDINKQTSLSCIFRVTHLLDFSKPTIWADKSKLIQEFVRISKDLGLSCVLPKQPVEITEHRTKQD